MSDPKEPDVPDSERPSREAPPLSEVPTHPEPATEAGVEKLRQGIEERITQDAQAEDERLAGMIRGGLKSLEVEPTTGETLIVAVQQETAALAACAQDALAAAAAPPDRVRADTEPHESLPRIGTPMRTRQLAEPRLPHIPGVAAIETRQEITWDHLVFIRATEHAPRIVDDRLVLDTPYAGTRDRSLDEVDPRTTLHFAVNHRVRQASAGWRRTEAEAPLTVILPARATVEKNGNPENFNEVDTFWDKSIELPEGTTILRVAGQTIEIPPALVGKIHIIDRDPKKTVEEDVADVLERLGYTTIKGGLHYSKTDGVGAVFRAFAEQAGLEGGIHQKHPSNIFEARYSKLDDADALIRTVELFLDPERPRSNPQAEELLARRLEAIATADSAYIERFAARNRISIEVASACIAAATRLIRGTA